MVIRQKIKESIKSFEFSKIDGQPMDEDLNQLTGKITKALASFLTTNGGGQQGHIGVIIPDAEYVTFSKSNAHFIAPTNPGLYPATVNPDTSTRKCQVAEHKAEMTKFETYMAVENTVRQIIVKCVDEEWLEAIKSDRLEFIHRSPLEMIKHLQNLGGDLDHLDVRDKYERQLAKCEINAQPALRLAVALSAFEASGEYDAVIHKWNAKATADKTFSNFCPYIQCKFTKCTKHNKATAKSVGRGIANQIKSRRKRTYPMMLIKLLGS
ncbi:hypothetical protein ACHAW6_009529 [Cyclotella cf. meneghiniana]